MRNYSSKKQQSALSTATEAGASISLHWVLPASVACHTEIRPRILDPQPVSVSFPSLQCLSLWNVEDFSPWLVSHTALGMPCWQHGYTEIPCCREGGILTSQGEGEKEKTRHPCSSLRTYPSDFRTSLKTQPLRVPAPLTWITLEPRTPTCELSWSCQSHVYFTPPTPPL